MSSVSLIDRDGRTVFQGTQSGGGGSQPVTREQFFGNNVSIANGASARLTWDAPQGDALLDLSDASIPTVVTTGVYAVTVSVVCAASLTAGGAYDLTLILDNGGDAPEALATSAAASTAQDKPQTCIGMTYYITAGNGIKITVHNLDGAATRSFAIDNAIVQRVA